jgi:hypothetical protein
VRASSVFDRRAYNFNFFYLEYIFYSECIKLIFSACKLIKNKILLFNENVRTSSKS